MGKFAMYINQYIHYMSCALYMYMQVRRDSCAYLLGMVRL